MREITFGLKTYEILYSVFIFIVLDVVSGLVKAIATKSFSSYKMRTGAMHKVAEILMIITMCICEDLLPLVSDTYRIPFVNVGSAYLIIMELGSCLENILALNPELSKMCQKVFGKILKESEENTNE